MGLRIRALIVLATLVLAGCQQEVYSNLSEADANQMLAVLTANGIAVDKAAKGAKDGFAISVDQRDMLRAIALLKDAGYPKSTYVSLAKAFEKTGIMSTPFEERVRYINALGAEVSQTLSQIDGVVSARVHIVLPDSPTLGQPVKPSSAAVFIKHQPGVDLDFFQPQIRRLVSSAVEGLDYSAVTVVLMDAAPTKLSTAPTTDRPRTIEVLPGLSLVEGSQARFWQIASGTGALLVVLLAHSLISLLSWWRSRRQERGGRSPATAMAMVEPS
ncbi:MULTISPECIES: type III secretion system inner membrane ring lipoprotein SctJ [Bradyrhizobium]|uniref:type III secretion system inner membrane ring lipoprotein SctJ n=1 Tax=Bradyrhizobium TaxID=374 RepID=UPI001BAADC13|nr:type III secretion inner membrane ring lipoprotein SctJ [Bradyrhizobium liaoningense]MBR0988360.1 type III secretion inner membrane ring lipoprotein SctJ [Bradyrhizobium liaoningense]GMP12228.1 type III secretion inner membrane ring lipoprotein SctJ [Bradyrhizobium sp. TM239]